LRIYSSWSSKMDVRLPAGVLDICTCFHSETSLESGLVAVEQVEAGIDAGGHQLQVSASSVDGQWTDFDAHGANRQ
jgi:hypothetical protein